MTEPKGEEEGERTENRGDTESAPKTVDVSRTVSVATLNANGPDALTQRSDRVKALILGPAYH